MGRPHAAKPAGAPQQDRETGALAGIVTAAVPATKPAARRSSGATGDHRMKGSPRSLWLTTANRIAGFWMGHATNALRQAQRAALKAAAKPPRAPRKPRRKG